jgi:membrane fusion protein, copper/silver efflux system
MKKNSNDSKPQSHGKTHGVNAITMTLFIALIWLAGCNNRHSSHEEHTYTCPMHPTVISDRPGSCPVCGMDLVLKSSNATEQPIGRELSDLLKSTNESVISSVKTINPEYKSIASVIEAPGVVTYDPRNIFTISSRVGGRIENIQLKYLFQPVLKGQKIADIYSPELITAQRELLFIISNDAKNIPLIESAKRRLQLLGMTDSQIAGLISSGSPGNTISITSQYSGYLIETSATATGAQSASAGPSGNAMGEDMAPVRRVPQTMPGQQVSGGLIKEGDYVAPGQPLFRVVGQSSIRVELDLSSVQAARIKQGDKLRIDVGNGVEQVASVDLLQPFFNDDAPFVKVRVTLENNRDLHVGHILKARIRTDTVAGLWVPREAVLDLGGERVVFVKTGNTFKPKAINTGITTEKEIEITHGLATADLIAHNAHYMVDSESNIKTEN